MNGGSRAPRVLAVDDQDDYLEALEALLAGEGYDVVTTTSATDALSRAREFSPTVLITDLNMHPCDGIEFLRKVAKRRLLPGVPTVILSSAPRETVRRRMREGGVEAEVIDKNADVELLLAALGRLCRTTEFAPAGGSQTSDRWPRTR